MTIHDAWAHGTSTPPATGDLRMDELTTHQLADELTTLAASMFGLLQPHPGSDAGASQPTAEARTASYEAPSIQDPASVVSVAIPVEPVVAIAVPEQWAPPEADAAATEHEPDAAFAVPALAVPELPDGLDKLDQREPALDQREPALDSHESEPAPLVPELDLRATTPTLRLVEPIDEPELEPQDALTPERESEPETPAPRQSMALLNEIAFLDD